MPDIVIVDERPATIEIPPRRIRDLWATELAEEPCAEEADGPSSHQQQEHTD